MAYSIKEGVNISFGGRLITSLEISKLGDKLIEKYISKGLIIKTHEEEHKNNRGTGSVSSRDTKTKTRGKKRKDTA